MKFVATIFAILAVIGPLTAYEVPATGSGEIAKHLQDILDLVPLDKLVQLAQTYYQKDKDFRLLISYMKSSESKLLVQDVEAASVFLELADYLQNNGLDVYTLANKLNEILDLPPMVPQDVSDQEILGGVQGYIQEMGELVPQSILSDLFDEKMANSKSFSDYVKFCTQPKFADFYFSLDKNVHFLALMQQIAQAGLDAEFVKNYYVMYLFTVALIA